MPPLTRTSRKRFASSFSPLLLLFSTPWVIASAAGGQVGPSAGSAPPKSHESSPFSAQPAAGMNPKRAGQDLRSGGPAPGAGSAWWHRKIGTELAITEAQKKQLDALSEALSRDLQGSQDKLRKARDSAQAALTKSDWAAARSSFEAQASQMAANIRRQGEAQISMLTLLTTAQRKAMADQHPNLLSTPLAHAKPARGADGRGAVTPAEKAPAGKEKP